MEMFNPPHPGEIIREDCLKPLKLSVTEAAKGLGVSRQSLSELLNGRNGISADMALRLENAGWSTAESWLRNQLTYDLWHAKQRAGRLRVTKFFDAGNTVKHKARRRCQPVNKDHIGRKIPKPVCLCADASDELASLASRLRKPTGQLSVEEPFATPIDDDAGAPIIPPGPAGARRRRVAAKTIRLRDKEHCKFVTSQPCLVCGRTPSEAPHVRFAQPRALGRKVSDEYTVPVCRLHRRDLHGYGDEASWWAAVSIDPLP